MKILVTGCDGQLGGAAAQELQSRGHIVIEANRRNMDLTSREAVEEQLFRTSPDAVVHCAAYTNVDRAEEEASLCRAVNVQGTAYIAEYCRQQERKLLYVSTDYVFGGDGGTCHRESDQASPMNVYGQSKYEGEQIVRAVERSFIVRTSWLFGKGGRNFVTVILGKAKQGQALQVVDDQIGSPTYAGDLAALLSDMVQSGEYGVYHATNEGECTWYGFAEEILRLAGIRAGITPVSAAVYGGKAKRPSDSRLEKGALDRAGFHRLPDWRDALERYIHNL